MTKDSPAHELSSYFVRAGRSQASTELRCVLLVCEDRQSDSVKVYRRCGKSATFSVPLALLQSLLYSVPGSLVDLTARRISQGPSLGGRATAHIMTTRYIYTAVRYVCFMDASACRQEIMDNFHFHAVCLSGAWRPPPEDIHIQ